MIDWERVNTLKEEVGPEDFDEVVELFLDEVSDVIARLEGSPDRSKLEDDLHFLKGSALGLGFRQFSNLCQIGETLSAEGRSDEVDLPAILKSFAESKVCFQQDLPKALAS